MRPLLAALAAALLLAGAALAAPPHPQARAWLVENPAAGAVLLQHAERRRVPIASITKLMTVLLTLERTRLDDVVTVSAAAAATGESSIYLRTGERLTVRDLLKAALIQSANDAADALADYVGRGDRARFVALMNAKARALGLSDTHFARPDGLDAPRHVSSARDVTRLATIVMRSPVVRRIVRERTDTIAGGRRLHTWNDLLSTFPGLIGVKTGHTSEARWNEVAAARGHGVTIYATLLGSPSRTRRNDDLGALLAWGLSRYRLVDAVSKDRVYARVEAPYGRPAIPLVARRALPRAVRVDRPLVERVTAPPVARLPVRRGQPLGWVRVYAGRRLVAREPLVAATSLGRPGLASRARWVAARAVHHVWGWLT